MLTARGQAVVYSVQGAVINDRTVVINGNQHLAAAGLRGDGQPPFQVVGVKAVGEGILDDGLQKVKGHQPVIELGIDFDVNLKAVLVSQLLELPYSYQKEVENDD